ncbi:MAG: class I SAM-dependent methyltransferase, partial [Thermodesulfobacteriota bacterium]
NIMLNEILHIIKITRPHHLIKTIYLPNHTFRKLKYHYRRVSEKEFIDFLSAKWNCTPDIVNSAYEDLNNNQKLWDKINQVLSLYPNSYGSQMTMELPCLYLLVRIIKPNLLVETGVASGASSAYILRALKDNEKGKLYSIDLPPDNLPNGRKSGWAVPETLRDRWDLRIGDAKIMLVPLLNEIGETDFFVHDSLHTYDHMMWEYKCVWPYLRQGGLFLSHDVGANEAFLDFMKKVNIRWCDYRVFHVLGGFRKSSNH